MFCRPNGVRWMLRRSILPMKRSLSQRAIKSPRYARASERNSLMTCSHSLCTFLKCWAPNRREFSRWRGLLDAKQTILPELGRSSARKCSLLPIKGRSTPSSALSYRGFVKRTGNLSRGFSMKHCHRGRWISSWSICRFRLVWMDKDANVSSRRQSFPAFRQTCLEIWPTAVPLMP